MSCVFTHINTTALCGVVVVVVVVVANRRLPTDNRKTNVSKGKRGGNSFGPMSSSRFDFDGKDYGIDGRRR